MRGCQSRVLRRGSGGERGGGGGGRTRDELAAEVNHHCREVVNQRDITCPASRGGRDGGGQCVSGSVAVCVWGEGGGGGGGGGGGDVRLADRQANT